MRRLAFHLEEKKTDFASDGETEEEKNFFSSRTKPIAPFSPPSILRKGKERNNLPSSLLQQWLAVAATAEKYAMAADDDDDSSSPFSISPLPPSRGQCGMQ